MRASSSSTYVAKILTENGAQLLTISATSISEAQELAASQGRLVYCRKELQLIPSRALNSFEREQLLTQLSYLTGAGVGTGQALRILQENCTGRMRDVAAELLSSVERGDSLPSAMMLTSKEDFPIAVQAVVWSGFRAGGGSSALEAAGQFEAELRDLKKESNGSLWSAGVGFVSAAVATVLSIFWMGPKILNSVLITSAGDSVNVNWAMSFGTLLSILMILMLSAGALLFANHLGVRKIFPLLADSITLRVPLWRDIALSQERYLSLFAVSALLAQHIELERAFESSIGGMPNGQFKKELLQASIAVKEGASWVDSFELLSPLDKAALRGATNREQLAQIFGKIADISKKNYAKARKTLAVSLQAIAALCLVMSGGIMFALTTLPLLQSAGAFF